MTPGRRLFRRLVVAALQAALVVAAMIDHAVGVGVVIGIVSGAVVTAGREHREKRKRDAESAELDRRLVAELARRRPIDVPVVTVPEEQLS